MNKNAAKIIFVILLLAVFGRIGYNSYKKDSCEYQMAKVKRAAYIDLNYCADENQPLKIRIVNNSSYDLAEYSFSVEVYKSKHSKRVSANGYSGDFIMPRGGELSACFAIPDVKGVSSEDSKMGHSFKVNISYMKFDKGNGKRLVCN
ncbi:MAG: hypothetical protein KAJ95_08455 [Gammaproteobacteria bacterium]|nr:hypothetical protein [Gammaproteobacteria bacterium]